jgi:RHS repeat-associated protein
MRMRRLAVWIVAAVVASGLSAPPAGAAPAVGLGTAEAPLPLPVEPTPHTEPYVVNEDRSAATDQSDPAWSNPTETLPPAITENVDVPSTGWATAPTLPVAVSRGAGVAVTRVRVRMLSQDEVTAAGGRFLGFELTRADGGAATGAVSVRLDYAGIARSFGGDFASRLRLVRVTTCSPGAACARPALSSANETKAHRLRGVDMTVRPDPAATPTAPQQGSGFGPQTDADALTVLDPSAGTTYTVMSASSGENGDYTASPLAGSDLWNVGVGSGAFTYSYPFTAPPAIAGAAPSLSLDYNSQAVDGRTSASNGQVSKVGEGWRFEPGYIERRFHSCRAENVARDDLCWSGNNEYFISFQGQSGELVRTGSTSNEWRIRGNDPGWRIVSFKACCANGDNDGEYFVVFKPDGTKYWFGYGVEPRSNIDTNSMLNVPVWASSSGEPCYSAVSAASWCQQAWRWNVDRILDTNLNVTSLFYAKETNKYARAGVLTQPTSYDRSGYLTKVEYGQRHLAENGTAYGRIRVDVAERCNEEVVSPCPTASPSSTRTQFPDVPLDLMCTSSTSCAADQTAPTFWSTKKVTSIQAEFWNAELATPAYDLVSTYDLSYSFPTTTDTTTPSLWLTDVHRTGEWGIGQDTTLPGVRFAGVAKANRVNVESNSPLYKYRVDQVSTELGARLYVTYGTPDPCPTGTVFAADTNPYDCYPVLYGGSWIPFHKYVVTDTTLDDVRGGQPDRDTHYDYVGTPAWHYADSVLANGDGTPQTWNDWRGYEDVRVAVAGSADSDGTDTRYLVFRGMEGDKLAGSGSKSEDLTDSYDTAWNDYDYRAGQHLEVKRYDPVHGHVASTAYRYWSQETVNGPNGFQSHDADYVRPYRVTDRVKNIATGLWRDRTVDHTFSTTTGQRIQSSDDQAAGGGDDVCAKTFYLANTATGTAGGDTYWMVDRPYRMQTYSDPCGTGAGAVLAAQTDFVYDGLSFQATPTNGNLTETRGYSGAATTSVTQTAYDPLGRVTSVKAPGEVAKGTGGVAATMSYSPAVGYPYNGVTVTDPVGRATKTVLYSAFGTPKRVVDVSNADTVSFVVDHLGRTTSVSRPGDATGMNTSNFTYHVAVGTPNYVKTERLVTDSAYVTTYAYVDGLGRPIQTQEPRRNAGETGRLVTMTRYDPLGQVAAQVDTFADSDDPVGGNLATIALSLVPRESRFGYDSLGRTTSSARYASGTVQTTETTDYYGTYHVVRPPVHSPVTYSTDVNGRLTRVVEVPSTGTTVTTQYDYTPLGLLDTITDADGNITDYAYDWLGRRTQSVDPDQGTWTTTYTPDGDVKTAKDAKLDVVEYAYDAARRRTDVYKSSVAPANLLAHWTYGTDGTNNMVGRLASATSYVGGSGGTAYTTSVGRYDNRGRVETRTSTVPGFGTYTYQFGYTQADDLATVTLPAAGGLLAETVTTTRNAANLPVGLTTSLDAAKPYVAATTYFADGRVAGRSLAGGLQRAFTYDAVGRLDTAQAGPAADPDAVESLEYFYDDDSNVTGIRDYVAGSSTAPQRECFTYDLLNRLKTAYTNTVGCSSGATTLGPDPYSVAYSYDALGDITQATNGTTATAYSYSGSGHAHAPKTIGGATYTYDANGATTKRTTGSDVRDLSWTPLHQLSSVADTVGNVPSTTSFVYDADGNRLLRDTGIAKTLYLDGMELTSVGGGAPTAVRYYGSVAMRSDDGKVRALLRNRQNSTSIAYDVTAATATYQRYTPFGAHRGTAAFPTEHGFLDKTEDATGLVALGARYYDPAIARFVSVDPLTIQEEPQSLAGYSYSMNNPATLSDPTGLVGDDAEGGSLDSDCVTAGNCSQKYTETARQQALTRATYTFGAGYLASHSADEVLIRAGRADLLTGPQIRTAVQSAEWAPEMLAQVGLLADEAKLTAEVSLLALLAVAGVAVYEAGPAVAAAWYSRGSELADEIGDIAPAAEAGESAAATGAGGLAGPAFRANTSHIFRDAPGHLLEDTATNRALLQGAIDPANVVSTNRWGITTYHQLLSDGRQVWVQVRNGEVITNGGVNAAPR